MYIMFVSSVNTAYTCAHASEIEESHAVDPYAGHTAYAQRLLHHVAVLSRYPHNIKVGGLSPR